MLAVAIMGGTITPILQLYAVQQAGAGRFAVLGATSPMFGLFLSVVLLRERAGRQTLIGAVLTMLGVWLII